MLLDKARRNEIFQALVSAGHDPREFDLSSETLTHRATGSTLSVGGHGERFAVNYVVGDANPFQLVSLTWSEGVLQEIVRWAEEIDRYSSMPDLWAELRSEHEVIARASAPGLENTPFAHGERSEIRRELGEVRHYARTALRLSEQQLQELDGRLRYLEEASERLGRKDWLNIALGTVITLAAEALLPPEEIRNVLAMILHPLSHLFGHPLPLLPPG